MRTIKLTLAALIALTAFSTPAFADTPQIVFEPEQVVGEMMEPGEMDGSVIVLNSKDSLISLRQSFQDRMIQSANDI